MLLEGTDAMVTLETSLIHHGFMAQKGSTALRLLLIPALSLVLLAHHLGVALDAINRLGLA